MGSNGQTTKENIIWGKTMNARKEQPVYYSLVVLFNENRFYITSIKPGMRIRAREKGPVTGKDLPDTNIGIAVSEKPGIAFGHGNKKVGEEAAKRIHRIESSAPERTLDRNAGLYQENESIHGERILLYLT